MTLENCPQIGTLRLDEMEPEVPAKITLIFPETDHLWKQTYYWFPCTSDGIALLSRGRKGPTIVCPGIPTLEPKRVTAKIYSTAQYIEWIRSVSESWSGGHPLATPKLEVMHSRYLAGLLPQFGCDELRQKVVSVIEQELAGLLRSA